jgi:hypothetical protein
MQQRLPLATSFFLLCHDVMTGKPLVKADLLRCGVVGAQFADLLLAGRVQMLDARVTPLDDRLDEMSDRAAAYVLEAVLSQPETHIVRTWVDNFEVLPELVARQLVEQGLVRREAPASLLRHRPDRFPAVDLVRAAGPSVRMRHALLTPQDMDLDNGVLAALIWAVGADSGTLQLEVDRDQARAVVKQIVAGLFPQMAELVEGVRAAAAAESLRVRR